MEEQQEVNKITNKYQTLSYDKENQMIKGRLPIVRNVNDEIVNCCYNVEIDLKHQPPQVKEVDGIIKKYTHIYRGGRLCLSTDIEQFIYIQEKGLFEWFEKYVISYFLTYEYYLKYRVYPFGEYSHDKKGEIESLSQILDVNEEHVIETTDYILHKNYRGHDLCPCGSGKRIRNCHKDIVLKYKKDEYREIFTKENNYLKGIRK